MINETLEEFEKRRHCSHTEATNEEVYNLQKEVEKLTKALERIANSKECDVCKCQQVMGKTYDGEGFRQLQLVARAALDATK